MNGTVSRELATTGEKLERWRQEHGGRGRWIPEELWKEAADVAQASGVETTARVLRLSEDRLRERMNRYAGKEDFRNKPEMAFVEMGALCGWRSVIELEGRDGERMRIEVTGAGGIDVERVCRTFWGRQP